MQRIKELFTGEDRAVSPVIGVILMVAITVILAAVIASFVLGLGDTDGPSPNPTVESDVSSQSLDFSFTGGDDFDATVSSVDATITISNTAGGGSTDVTFDAVDLTDDSGTTNSIQVADSGGTITSDNVDITFTGTGSDEATAGDDFDFAVTVTNAGSDTTSDYEVTDWNVEVVWNPSDQDSTTIYSEEAS